MTRQTSRPVVRRTLKPLFCVPVSYLYKLKSKRWSEPVSSVSIVSGYGLDDGAIEFGSPAEAKAFLLYPLCPDRLWGPPSPLHIGYRGSFLGAKTRPGRDADHSPLSNAEMRMSRSYISSPPSVFVACSGTALALASKRWRCLYSKPPLSWRNDGTWR
jgi:hypothetical protein